MNQEIDFSTLTWVKNELDATLREARQSLEAHVENTQDEAQLGFLAAHLHQVYGTLRMVELYGASLLAEEMEQVAMAMAAQTVTRHEDACDVLMRSILQLPDYLDRLIAGYRDIPLVLLPVLNDLRAVRGENLLSENHMFSPDLDAELPGSVMGAAAEGELRERARELRHRFQLGLLGWFKGKHTEDALESMGEVFASLQELSTSKEVARLWWVAGGMVDAVQSGMLDSGIAVKRLIGQMDRQIKQVVDHGENALEQNLPQELFKNLLFYVGQAHGAGARVNEIQSTYRLHDLLPGEEELAAARESMAGQNADLFSTVAVAVKEELGRLKDTLDIVLRNGCQDLDELQPLADSLRSLGDTLGMLSLGAVREAVIARADELQVCIDAGETPTDTSLMDVASTLLFVESSVDSMGSGRAVANTGGAVEEQLAASEFSQVMDVVIQEAITDLVRAKEAIVAYIESNHDVEALGEVPQWFSQVKGGLLLLGETRPAALVDSIGKYIENELIRDHKQPPSQELDSLADAVCGLEYYLESRKERRMYGSSAMVVAEESIDRLGYPLQHDAQDEDAPAQEDGSEPESVVSAEEPDSGESDVIPGLDLSVLDELDGVSESQFPDAANEAEQAETLAEPLQTEQVLEEQVQEEQVQEEQVQEEQVQEPVSEDVPQVPVESPPMADSEQVAEEDDGLAIIGEDVDEEILEIFIEEAEEEMASINEQLPAWISDADNQDALASMRRSWHTLKGSGRLVGALRIGEFAWSCENLLNRVIDGTLPVTPDVTGLLQSAVDTLPGLVQQIKDGSPVQQPVSWLMRCADALCKGEPLPEGQVATAGNIDEPAAAEIEAVAPDHEPVADDRVAPPEAEETETAVPEAGAVEEEQEQEQEQAPEVEDVVYNGVMDPMLYEIFNSETRGHLEDIRQFLNQVAAGNSMADESLARALHTLHGSAHMAEANEIAELAGKLERWIKAQMGAQQPLSESGCDVLLESAGIIDEMLSGLPSSITEPERYVHLLQQAETLYESVPEPGGEETLRATDEQREDPEVVADDVPGDFEPLAAEVTADDGLYGECDAELLEIFLEESADNLETCDAALHRWRENHSDKEALAELQRALHTVKGGARMADIVPVGDLAHAAESLIIAIADGLAGAGPDALDGVQQAQDDLVNMLDQVRRHQPAESAQALIRKLEALRTRAPDEEAAAGDVPEDSVAAEPEPRADEVAVADDPYAEIDPELLEVFLEEAGDILENSEQTLRAWQRAPDDIDLMTGLQRELHTLKGGARMADITEIGDLAHAIEALMVKVTHAEISPGDELFAVLGQAHDSLTGMLDKVHKHQPLQQAETDLKNLELLAEGRKVAVVTEPQTRAKASKSSKKAHAEQLENELEERRGHSRAGQELVRVKAALLDNMVNYAGEVSIYRSRLEQQIGAYRFNLVEMEQTVTRVREQLRKMDIETEAQVLFRYEREGEGVDAEFDPLEMDRYSHMQQLSRSLVESVSDLGSIQGMLENITRESETLLLQQSRVNTELQEGLMRTRMVPFLGLSARMRRIIRQTAQELGKKVELELSGAEGEMDRTVVDRIVAPIEHMLRNAISHGIESPEQRRKAGKPETGIIKITLERESSDVVLRIADDGAGISLDAIRRKAVERGLMKADADLTDSDVLQFILETGFSTAEKVTQVSGRGVGMDVVNSEVKQLGGSLHIDSQSGKGTTFTIRLPFTLALNQALLIEVGEDTYAIPLSSIEGIVRMRREDLKSYYDDPDARFDYGSREYEVRHLGSVLGSGHPHLDSGPSRVPLLLARVSDHNVAFQVENLMGSREIVVKSVGSQISTVRGVSGATILGDGRVVMILDIAALLRGGVAPVMEQVQDMLQQPADTRGLTVMVVDDSITVRKVTTRLLERNDMNVIAAKDGVDAVAKLQEHIPDIMLLDIEMPRMDGFELATHVRNEARLRNIPIIMITSRTGDKHRQRAMKIGVNRYLGKPFQETELMENINALLEETSVNG